MAEPSPALSIAQPLFSAISETAEALRAAARRGVADLEAIEKELVATAAVVEFTMAEPIRHTERRFVGEGEARAADTAWCMGFRQYGSRDAWRLTVVEYYREYEPIGAHAAIRILRNEMPLVEASAEIRLAAMDHLVPFLQQFHDALRQALGRSQVRTPPALSQVPRPAAGTKPRT